ncbi:MAG: hypothetical protein R3D43_15185 [Tepidamorphaceae bacterium]
MATEHLNILPPNATAFERLFSEVVDPLLVLAEPYDAIRLTAPHRAPPPALLPFLIWQYGLGELTPYVPSLYQLIDKEEGFTGSAFAAPPLVSARVSVGSATIAKLKITLSAALLLEPRRHSS